MRMPIRVSRSAYAIADMTPLGLSKPHEFIARVTTRMPLAPAKQTLMRVRWLQTP